MTTSAARDAQPQGTAGNQAQPTAERLRKIRLLASDIDGTLLNSDHRVLPAVRKAVAEAEAAGLTIVLASARSPTALAEIAAALGHDGPAICFSGGWTGTIEPRRSRIAAAQVFHIQKQAALAVAEKALDLGLVPSWHCEQAWLVPLSSPEIEREARVTHELPHVTSRLQDAPEPNKILVIGPPVALVALSHSVQMSHGRYLETTFSHPDYLEVLPHGVDKAAALVRLAARRGIRAEEIAAVGDGENDLGMIRAAGLGVAMANAPPPVQDAADWITANNDDAGVARFIRLIIDARRQ